MNENAETVWLRRIGVLIGVINRKTMTDGFSVVEQDARVSGIVTSLDEVVKLAAPACSQEDIRR